MTMTDLPDTNEYAAGPYEIEINGWQRDHMLAAIRHRLAYVDHLSIVAASAIATLQSARETTTYGSPTLLITIRNDHRCCLIKGPCRLFFR